MKTYIALFEYEEGKSGFSVLFPDLPGLISAGDDYKEAVQMAHEGLALHIRFLQEEGDAIPDARTLEQIMAEWADWREWEQNCKFLVTPIVLLPVTTKSKRINVMINEGLLAKIDMVAKNRSEYVSRVLENAFV